MALDGAVTKVSSQDVGDGEVAVRDVVGPSSYVNGGEGLAGNYLALRVGNRLDAVEGRAVDPAQGYAKLNGSTGLLEFFTAADVEEANLANLSGDTYRLTVQGR